MKKNIGRRLVLALLVFQAAALFSQDSTRSAVINAASCPDPLGAVNGLYDSTEASHYAASLRFFAPGAGPVYRQAKIAIEGNVVRFSLQRDRRRPDGREYNYFTVEAVLSGCQIKSLTVIEQITWL